VHIDDTPPVLGASDAAGVNSAQTFNQWFQDTVGVNESAQERLLFSQDETGAWEFEADDFRPIDGQLLSEGQAGANRNFTLDLDGQFNYSPCTGQFFEFEGDGDALVYVDGKLVLELAGNNAGVEQRVDIDRLNLDPGTTHRLQFFYAQRSCSASSFHVRTSITLDTKYRVEKGTSSFCD
jgi:fibro-slime domain-containing protein